MMNEYISLRVLKVLMKSHEKNCLTKLACINNIKALNYNKSVLWTFLNLFYIAEFLLCSNDSKQNNKFFEFLVF